MPTPRTRALETEIEWAPNAAWHFGLGLAYVNAVVKNVPALCCTSDFKPVIADYTAANAPEWSGNAMARYTIPLGAANLAFQVDGNYLSHFWFNLGDAPSVRQDAYGVANARINYAAPNDKYEVGVSLENLSDKHYGVMGFDNTGVNGLAQRYPGMPRWFKAHVDYKF